MVWVKGHTLPAMTAFGGSNVRRGDCSKDPTVYLKVARRVDLKYSHHKQTER